MTTDIISADESVTPREAFEKLHKSRVNVLPIINKSGELLGVMTKKGAVRSELYKPALNKKGEFVTAVAMNISGDVIKRAQSLVEIGVDIIAIDTAHGHSRRMIDAVKAVRESVGKEMIIHAAQVATGEATEDRDRFWWELHNSSYDGDWQATAIGSH